MTIIFSSFVTGHYMEYLHHIYEVCVNNKNEEYLFLVPEDFNMYKSNLYWPNTENIRFDYFDTTISNHLQTTKKIQNSWIISKLLRQKIKQYKANKVFATNIMYLLPFIPFLLSNRVKLSGIIYMVYLYNWNDYSIIQKFQHIIKYLLMSRFKLFDRVLILNDSEGARKLNKQYRTNIFLPIVDPYFEINTDTIKGSFRDEFKIKKDSVVISQFGALNKNKGTLEVLDSIIHLPCELSKKCVFVFAGRIGNDIQKSFNNKLAQARKTASVIVKEGYCTYEFFAELCYSSDAFVIPYRRTAQSSGIIGYASQFGKPVIAPAKGLLGELVSRFELGITIKNTDPDSLVDAYRAIVNGNYTKPTRLYCESNTIEEFKKTIDICIKA